MTEQKAIEGCKKQDRKAQKHIFDRYSDGMLMVCLRYVKNLPDAEEMMLNGFYNFYRSIDRFNFSGEGNTGGWLKKIMVNECLMFLRKKGVLKIIDDRTPEKACDDDAIARMNANELLQLVMELPEGYRTVFNLFVIEGYSHKEIAAMLEITESTSKTQLIKAKAALKKAIKKNETYYER